MVFSLMLKVHLSSAVPVRRSTPRAYEYRYLYSSTPTHFLLPSLSFDSFGFHASNSTIYCRIYTRRIESYTARLCLSTTSFFFSGLSVASNFTWTPKQMRLKKKKEGTMHPREVGKKSLTIKRRSVVVSGKQTENGPVYFVFWVSISLFFVFAVFPSIC